MPIHHPNRLKTALRLFVFFGCCLWTAIGYSSTVSPAPPPTEGGHLPDIRLELPADPVHRAYLGLSGEGSFTIPEIGAEIVIVEIFSMY